MKECQFCHSNVSHLNKTTIDWGVDKGKKAEICDICYNTHAGNILNYYNNYSHDVRTIVQTIVEVGNMVREELLLLKRNGE